MGEGGQQKQINYDVNELTHKLFSIRTYGRDKIQGTLVAAMYGPVWSHVGL